MSDSENPKPKPTWIPSPNGIAQIYTNAMHATWTLDDVRMRFGQLVTSPETPNPGPGFKAAVEERVDITSSWRNVKIMVNELSMLIASYEKDNGEIVIDIKLPEATR